jgi:hypothetical protein
VFGFVESVVYEVVRRGERRFVSRRTWERIRRAVPEVSI